MLGDAGRSNDKKISDDKGEMLLCCCSLMGTSMNSNFLARSEGF